MQTALTRNEYRSLGNIVCVQLFDLLHGGILPTNHIRQSFCLIVGERCDRVVFADFANESDNFRPGQGLDIRLWLGSVRVT